MGNYASTLFSEQETTFCFITNSKGKILHSSYVDKKWSEKETEIQEVLQKYFSGKLQVKKKKKFF